MRASYGYTVRAPCAPVLFGPSISTLAEITQGSQGPPRIHTTPTRRKASAIMLSSFNNEDGLTSVQVCG